MSRIEEIKERLSKIDPNMKLYKCDSNLIDKDEACGIYEGQSLDCSYDECHHPLSRDLADYIVNTPADIEYLLTKLEIAEKALELYAERTNWRASLHYDKVNMRRTDIHGFMDVDPWEIADKTLQQIRS